MRIKLQKRLEKGVRILTPNFAYPASVVGTDKVPR
jgi:hypothetical protein